MKYCTLLENQTKLFFFFFMSFKIEFTLLEYCEYDMSYIVVFILWRENLD